MEIVGLIVGGIILSIVVSVIRSLAVAGVTAGGRAVKKAVTGKEVYFGPPEIKFVNETMEKTGWLAKRIMFRGRLPISRDMDIAFGISAIDVTDGKDDGRFVLSLVDAAQEENSTCFYRGGEFGRIEVGTSITDWVELGFIIPEILQTAYSGNREIDIVVRMFDLNNPPQIYAGFSSGGEVILTKALSFNHNFTDKGYEEASRDKEEAQAISLKIGVAVAMSDGTLDETEGAVLKNWIIKEVGAFHDEKQNKLKKLFNGALKEGFSEAKEGNLSLSTLVDRLAEIGDKKTRYDAVELCLDIMAADGVAAPEEMSIIRNVAKSLDLNMDEIEKMREKVTLDLSTELTSEEGLESLVGIDQSWSDEEKSKFIRSEFQKWSNRLNTLSEGQERDSAQSMLDNIAIIRKKYG